MLSQMTEISTFEADIVFSIAFGALIFPMIASWTTAGGWLYDAGFHDVDLDCAGFLCSVICGLIVNLQIGHCFDSKQTTFM
jgi:ammonia channel protein AmtB